VLVGLHEASNKVHAVLTEGKDGIGNIDPQSQNFWEVSVGESVSGTPLTMRHVDGKGERNSQIPLSEAVGDQVWIRGDAVVGPSTHPSNMLQIECGVVDQEECHVLGDPLPLEVNCLNGPIGPQIANWNPFLDVEDQEESGEDSRPGFVGEFKEQTGGVQLDIEENSRKGDVEGNRVNEVERLSQLTESSSGTTQERDIVMGKKASKKGPHLTRSTHPLVGIPKFQQLAMAVNGVGRRRKDPMKSNSKEGDHSRTVLRPQTLSIADGCAETPPIDLQVLLPVPAFGLNKLFDCDGRAVSDSLLVSGGGDAQKKEEAKILIEIQKEVGFTFEMGEDELQSKLVELDDVDRAKNVVREQVNGYQ
jgi:hypothetical protein